MPFRADVAISDHCAEEMAADQISSRPRLFNLMNERLKGGPGNPGAWDLGLHMGHFSVIPGHLLSLGLSFILLESESANPISQLIF